MTKAAAIPTLMIIDDSRADVFLFNRVIRRSGLVGEVIDFAYAEDALAFLREPTRPHIDVILLDINMPRMNGFEFLEAAGDEFGESFAGAVVVMLTTSLDVRDVRRAEAFEAIKFYVHKPLTSEHLQHIAEEVAVRSGSASEA